MRLLNKALCSASALTFILLSAAAQARAAVTFQRLDFIPHDVSADGSVVVGERIVGEQYEAVRWTADGGTVGLGLLPSHAASRASGVSADGSVIVGSSASSSLSESRAFRWTVSTGLVDLGTLPGRPDSNASAVSADGSVVVGTVGGRGAIREAFRWTAPDGMVGLGPWSAASGVSADGSVVVGDSGDGEFGNAIRWTASTGWVDLGAGFPSYASAASADGSVVVGGTYSGVSFDGEAFRWTASAGPIGMGHLPGSPFSRGLDISADGSVVVGDEFFSLNVVIWDETHGMRSLRDVLEGLGADLAGVPYLGFARAISADGHTIIGETWDPDPSQRVEWVATVPEPAGLTLLATGLAGLLGRRRA